MADNMADKTRKGRGRNGVMFGDNNPSRKYPEKRPRGDAQWTRRFPEKLHRGEAHWHHRHKQGLEQ
jgi:hypothetical protein